MSVTYNYTKADGSITNNPYEYDASGKQVASNQYQGRADGYDGAITTYATPNQPSYSDPSGGGGPVYRDPTPMPMPRPGGASLGGGGGGGYGSSTYSPNPYLQQQANGIQSMANQNLQQNILPGIRSGAQANGQYGSSRQGIAEGVAAGNSATGVASAQAGLYGSGYNTDQANQTARIGLSNNYNLGLGSLGNQATAQNQNFYTQQRGQDLQQYQTGSSLYGSGVSGQLGVGSGQYGVGQQAQQAPLNALQQYSNSLSPYTGLNSSQQQSVGGPGVVNSALGGALAGGQIAKNLGFGSYSTVPSSSNTYTGTNDFSGVTGRNAQNTWGMYGTGGD